MLIPFRFFLWLQNHHLEDGIEGIDGYSDEWVEYIELSSFSFSFILFAIFHQFLYGFALFLIRYCILASESLIRCV